MENKRYLLNIRFKNNLKHKVSNIVETFKTKREATEYSKLIDETVDKAILKDNVTGVVEWLK